MQTSRRVQKVVIEDRRRPNRGLPEDDLPGRIADCQLGPVGAPAALPESRYYWGGGAHG